MASSLALKRLVSSSLVSTRSLRPVFSSSRLINTNAVRDYDSDDHDVDVDRLPNRRVFSPFPDSFTFEMLKKVERVMEKPMSSSVRRNWHARESDEGVHLRVDMPGLGIENIKTFADHKSLTIQGEGKEESVDYDAGAGGRKYTLILHLPEYLYNTKEIRSEMKNGVLKLFVPKIKEEERSDVVHGNVE